MMLATLPGVGPALEKRLVAAYGSSEAVLAACEGADLAGLQRVEGVSARRAATWCRIARGQGDDERLLATPAARRVHDELIERLVATAMTEAGRDRLRLLGPLAGPGEAQAAAKACMVHATMAAGLDRDAVRRLLSRIKPLREPRPRYDPTRLVACTNGDEEDRLHRLGVQRWCSVSGLRGLREAGDHELVVLVGDEEVDVDIEHVVHVRAGAPLHEIVPEAQLAWAAENRASLQAASDLLTLLGLPTSLGKAPGDVATIDATRLRPAIEAVRKELDPALRAKAGAIQLTGDDVLAAVSGRLPRPLQTILDETLREARQTIRARTGIDIQAFEDRIPLTIDEDELARVEERTQAMGRRRGFEERVKAARAWDRLRPLLEKETQDALDLDVPFALGCFVNDHDLQPATIGEGFAFDASIHLALATDKDATRIGYRLGGDEPVALLTGANSGGKSTLLEHLCQLAVMARMGLPVVGGATVPWVEEIHFVTARRGLDAGAFETFLRGFLPLCEGGPGRLILVDEVEAVTELEAASRILGFFLSRLGPGTLAVVVTHLGPQVLVHAPDVRVDGIEATGLDDEHRLIVDRRPVMGRFARSTPELIVARLARTDGHPLYQELLDVLGKGHK